MRHPVVEVEIWKKLKTQLWLDSRVPIASQLEFKSRGFNRMLVGQLKWLN